MIPFERIAVAGVGLIGGSLGLAVRERGLARRVVGFGRSRANLEIAVERGAIDGWSLDPLEASRDADLLVLGVPVGAMAATAAKCLAAVRPTAIVIDVGSVKAPVVAALEGLVSPPAAFVGCHPIAGTEHSGAASALAGLFEGERCILTPTPRTDSSALERIRRFWEAVGMRVETMDPEAHDRLLALVSHLPHVVAYSLVAAVEDDRVGERDPLAYAGGALRDTTRVASSEPRTWRDIFLGNRAEVGRAIDRFERAFGRLKDSIAAGDGDAIERELSRLRAARGRLRKR